MFKAQTASPYFSVVFRRAWPGDPMNGYRIVIVTDQRTLVCSTVLFRRALIRGIKRRFHQVIREADDARPDAY
jgi:hypothetical protein